jgi:hypothetical protein
VAALSHGGVISWGAHRLYDMLQHRRLNKRLFYCILEAFLLKAFPSTTQPSKLKELFTKLHECHKPRA